MTTLVMGLAGAAIGGFFGGPTGARIGWAIGTYLGQRMSEPDSATVGPRLDDLQVTSSIYGASIPITYGRMRAAGNMIWSSDIREEKHVEDVGGGKGSLSGGSQTHTTYTYFASFAIAFSEGVAKELNAIWADGKLIWNLEYGFAAPDAEDGTLSEKALGLARIVAEAGSKGTIRFYPGNEEQLPDPLIMSHEGTDIPAHRGLCYVVFDDMPLKDYGNRIPNITAEISYIDPPSDFIDQWYNTNLIWNSYGEDFGTAKVIIVPIVSRSAIFMFINKSPVTSDMYILKFDMETLALLGYRNVGDHVTNYGGTSYWASWGISRDEDDRLHLIKYPIGSGDPDYGIIYRVDPFTLIPDELWIANFASTVIAYGPALAVTTAGVYIYNTDASAQGGIAYSYIGSNRGIVPNAYFLTGGVDEGPLQLTQAIQGNLIGIRTVQTETAGFDPLDPYYEDFRIVVYTIDVSVGGIRYSTDLNIEHILPATTRVIESDHMIVNSFNIDGATKYEPLGVGQGYYISSRYLEYDNSLLAHLWIKDDSTSFNLRMLIKISLSGPLLIVQNGPIAIQWAIPDTDPAYAVFDRMFIHNRHRDTDYVPVTSAEYYTTGAPSDTGMPVYKLDLDTGTYELFDTILDSTTAYDMYVRKQFTINNQLALYGSIPDNYGAHPDGSETTPLIFRLGIKQKDDIDTFVDTLSLADVVRDICSRVGLDPTEDLDVFELEPYIVPGYTIPRQMEARAPIQQLATLYLFDMVESDYKLVGKMRGRAPVATLNEEEFAIIDEASGEVIKETRVQEVELPVELAVTYKDKSSDYNPNTQRSMRSQQPIPTMESVHKVTEEIPIAQDATFIKRAVEKILYAEWLNRTTYEGTVSWRWLKLDPADVILITMNDGTIYEARITQNEFQGQMAIPLSMLSEQAALFTSDAEGYSGDGYRPWEIITYGPTKLFLLNIPLLRDVDSVQREFHQVYYAASGLSGNWPGATILTSTDGLNYNTVGQMPNESPWGVIQGALPQTDTPFITDYDTELVVFMQRGGDTLESVSRSQILTDSANAAAVITAGGSIEVIQYEFAIENPDGSYTLSGLYRGRRGTDYLVNDHGVGEYILMLSPESIDRLQYSLDQHNISKEYRAVTYGTLLDDAESIDFAPTGVELMPYAPVHQAATENAGDIDLTWVRRTRINGGWKDGTGIVPLNEDTEEYELEIYDGPGGTLLRTYTGITSPSYTYPSADITTDFGSVPSELTIKVYQISAQVGRGFSNEVTIPVE